jgi:uncharacterized membrane protein
MTKTVVALFDNIQQAHDAVRDLNTTGISRENISLVSNDVEGTYSQQLDRDAQSNLETSDTAENIGKGAGAGAVIGGLGGLVVGLGALAIPGIGPVVAAGPIATTLAGAGVGAVAGGLVGALVDIGVPEEDAKLYSEGVRRGGTLLTVQADEQQVDQVIDMLNQHRPVDIKERREQWSTGHDAGLDRDVTTSRDYGSHQDFSGRGSLEEDITFRDDSVTYDSNRVDYTDEGMERDVYMRADDVETTGMERQNDFEQQWRMHFEQTNRQGRFEDYVPAYRYGHRLNERENFRNREWLDIEREIQMDWEQRNPDYPYNDYREYIRSGWESGRSRM